MSELRDRWLEQEANWRTLSDLVNLHFEGKLNAFTELQNDRDRAVITIQAIKPIDTLIDELWNDNYDSLEQE